MVDLLERKRKSGVKVPGVEQTSSIIDASGRIVINQSRVRAWRDCYRKHHYRYELKLQRKRIKRPLVFGKAVHELIEAYANGDDPMETLGELAKKNRKMFAKELETFGDIVSDLRYIMTAYFDYWEKHEDRLRYIRMNKKASEHTFEIEIAPGLLWKGTIDAFGKSKHLKWLVEHKTFKKEWSEDERWRNLQGSTYRRAAKLMGWPTPDGILWDYVHSKPPTRPKFTTTGKISERGIVTLPAVIDDFIAEHKLKRKDMAAMIEAAEACVPRYFMRIYTPANEEVEEKIFEDFLETAFEIGEDHDRKKARNIGKHCGWCDYEPLCRTELTGGDVDFVMKREYELEKDEHKSRSELEASDE